MPATPAKQGVVTLTAENLHGVPHGEVVVFTRDTDGPGASSILFNTLGLPDEMTDEQFRALDPEGLKAPAAPDAARDRRGCLPHFHPHANHGKE